jgi:hypothetical protein
MVFFMIPESRAQGDLQLSRSFARPGESFYLTVSSSSVSFVTDEPSSCPEKLHVEASNIRFISASGTNSVSVSEVTSQDGALTAKVSVAADAPHSYYTLTVGDGEPCSITRYYGFRIGEPEISVIPSYAYPGDTINMTIYSSGVSFSDTLPGNCPDLIHMNQNGLLFSNGTLEFRSAEVTASGSYLTAKVIIPRNATGFYNLKIGDGEPCPVNSSFAVYQRPLQFSPSKGLSGNTVTVKITGGQYTYTETGESDCVNNLKVSASNIVFRSASGTSSPVFSPSSISVNGNTISAVVSFPDVNKSELFYITVGEGEACPQTPLSAFLVEDPASSIYPADYTTGQTQYFYISSNYINFVSDSSTICPDRLSVSGSSVVFKQGSATIMPDNISLNGEYIYGSITVPAWASAGYYDVVIGEGEACPLVLNNAVQINPVKVKNIDVYPSSAAKEEQLTVSITGTDIYFKQSSSTICPDLFNVTPSSVVFRQASGTAEFYPSSVTITGSSSADLQINVPSFVPQGYYDVILGIESACPVTKYSGFYVREKLVPVPSVNVVNSDLKAGAAGTLVLAGRNVRFDTLLPTQCPSLLNVTVSNVILKQGSGTIAVYPQAVKVSDTLISASFNLPATVTEGYYDVLVGSGEACPLGLYAGVYIQGKPQPAVTMQPSSGVAGRKTEVVITGYNISFTAKGATVCPDLLNVSETKILLRQSFTGNEIELPDLKISGNSLTGNVKIPDDAQGYYDLIAGAGGSCPVISNYAFYVNQPEKPLPSISVTPGVITKGVSAEISVKGENIKFQKSGNDQCPSVLTVKASDIVFRQASSVIFSPASVSLKGTSQINAVVSVPVNIPTGYYDVIVGANSACPVTLYSGLYINESSAAASLNVTPAVAYSGEKVQLNISGLNLTLSDEGSVLCDDKLLDSSSVVLKKGDKIIKSDDLKSSDGYILSSFNIPADAESGEYEVVVGYGHNCSYNSRIQVDPTILSTTDAADASLLKAEIYPNPNDGSFIGLRINVSGSSTVIVSDQMGHELLNTQISELETDLASKLPANLSAGIYFVKVVSGQSSKSLKFVVK